MREVNLKIKGSKRLNCTVLIDGKGIKAKKNKFGSLETTYKTDKDSIEVSIYRYLEVNTALWWLMSILFFVMSIFGILDPIKEKNCIVLEYKSTIKLSGAQSGNVEITINATQKEGKAIDVKTDFEVIEYENIYYVDQRAKRRLKIMKAVKFLIVIGCGVLLALLANSLIKI